MIDHRHHVLLVLDHRQGIDQRRVGVADFGVVLYQLADWSLAQGVEALLHLLAGLVQVTGPFHAAFDAEEGRHRARQHEVHQPVAAEQADELALAVGHRHQPHVFAHHEIDGRAGRIVGIEAFLDGSHDLLAIHDVSPCSSTPGDTSTAIVLDLRAKRGA